MQRSDDMKDCANHDGMSKEMMAHCDAMKKDRGSIGPSGMEQKFAAAHTGGARENLEMQPLRALTNSRTGRKALTWTSMPAPTASTRALAGTIRWRLS